MPHYELARLLPFYWVAVCQPLPPRRLKTLLVVTTLSPGFLFLGVTSHAKGEGMQPAEMARIIEVIKSSFQPYQCGVEPQPVEETHKTSLRIKVSNENDSLVFSVELTLKALEADFSQDITWWRELATTEGFELDPL